MEILYRDESILVVVKPRGVLSEAGTGELDSVPALLAPDFGSVFPVHRLDFGVGGVMVYARTKAAAAALSRAVTEQRLKKTYLAVVAGLPTPAEGEWQDLLFKDARQNKSFVVDTPRKGAREARLRYRVEGRIETPEGPLSLVEVTLITGRSHQIRVQFASRGHSLVGDGKYGSRRKGQGPALFAAGLSFPHPKSGKLLSFRASPPWEEPFTLFGSAAPEIERKFLIALPDERELAAQPQCRVQRMVQTYLLAPCGETRRVRRIEEAGEVLFWETRKRRRSNLAADEWERPLTAEEYEALLAEADPRRSPIHKTRYAFPYGGRVAEVDVYPFFADRAILEVELASEEETVEIPPFLRVIREVSDDPRYKNVNLAKAIPEESL